MFMTASAMEFAIIMCTGFISSMHDLSPSQLTLALFVVNAMFATERHILRHQVGSRQVIEDIITATLQA
jgi:hypothetical protein